MNEKTKREIGIVWGAFMSICIAVMIIVLLYIMLTGQDIKNIHVAIVAIIAAQAMDRWPKKEGGKGENHDRHKETKVDPRLDKKRSGHRG